MKNFIISVIVIFIFFAFSNQNSQAFENQPVFNRDSLYIQTQNGKKKYDIELAISKKEQEQGLMFRKELAKNEGMIFISPLPRVIKMWMKNTFIPLDMLFIDSYGKIIHIADNNKPYTEKIISAGDVKSKAVLEILGGQAQEQNIQIGDKVIYKVFKNVPAKK